MIDPYYLDEYGVLYCGDVNDVLSALDDASVQCCLTSPPYWGLRDYGVVNQLGMETTIEEYVRKMVGVFREVRRVLKKDGILWLNLGDSYVGSVQGVGAKNIGKKQITNTGSDQNRQADRLPPSHKVDGLKSKDLAGIPWRVAFALQADGWWLRQDIIWSKRNPMPESVRDRCTKAHEYVFLLTRSKRYYFDQDAIKEHQASSTRERAKYGWSGVTDDGSKGARTGSSFKRMAKTGELMATMLPKDGMRNKRSVWTVTTQGYKDAHFATFPPKLIEPMILAGSRPGDMVLDPFIGSGTTAMVAKRLGRRYVGIDLKEDYLDMAIERIRS